MPIGRRAMSPSGATGFSDRCVRLRMRTISIWSPAEGRRRHNSLSHRVIVAVEVMTAGKLHDPDTTHILQMRTQTLRVVIAIDAERRGYGELLHLGTHRQALRAVQHPVG